MKKIETNLRQKIGLLILGFIAALVFLELLLRIFGGAYLLYRQGFNGSKNNIRSVYRILCLGDSFTLGVGAGKEEDYPAQLKNMLKKSKPQKYFEVINKGVGGYNSAEVLYYLDKNLDKYEPDLVILMIGTNDGHNTHLNDWALGQKEWYVKISSWITGLRIYKLINFVKLSISQFHNVQELNHEVDLRRSSVQKNNYEITYRSSPVNIKKEEVNEIANEVKRLFKNGKNEKANNLLVETSNKENVWEYLNIAKAHNALQTEENIIKEVLKTDQGDDWMQFSLGMIYLSQNKFNEAETIFKSIIENNPNNNYIRYDLAWLYISQKRYNDAEGLIKEAIKVQGKSLRAVLLLIYCYNAQGKHTEADKLRENARFYEKITDLNVSAIKNKILERNVKLIIMSYPLNNYISENIMQGVTYIDNMKIFNGFSIHERDKLFSADSNHCNAEGYRLIAQNVFKHIFGRSDF